ncbi:PAS domain-containing sensor histidine kinase [uncultured Roseobacter sp.]|uniref:PAS domain-containing sensor histidine kinase n=1 Tax=uncultured Roseobacter sp. TaxID=114847 RepID=UPI0026035499|nr:PAS domain-containing sensor histidine kinase [uncultured Roseobacter sp.]
MVGQIDKESLTWRLTPDLLGILDETGVFTDTNPAWFKTLGRLPEDIESRQFFDFLHPDDMADAEQAFADIQKGKAILQFENRYRHKDGSYRWLSWNAVPEEGLFFCSARDITAAKNNEAMLKTREDEARLREQFIAVLSHDLRSPVAAVSSAIWTALRQEQTEKSRRLLLTAEVSLVRMTGLISDVMDFARARLGGDIGIDAAEPVALKPVLEQVVQEIRLANSGVVIVEDFFFYDQIQCDAARIGQLLSNLVSNAVFHGDQYQPIRVRAFDDGIDLILTVTNFGKPIPPAAQAKLFEPFTRAEVMKSQNGLGLGLFIAQQIALGHGGTLTVRSDEAETEFRLTLPRMDESEPSSEDQEEPSYAR